MHHGNALRPLHAWRMLRVALALIGCGLLLCFVAQSAERRSRAPPVLASPALLIDVDVLAEFERSGDLERAMARAPRQLSAISAIFGSPTHVHARSRLVTLRIYPYKSSKDYKTVLFDDGVRVLPKLVLQAFAAVRSFVEFVSSELQNIRVPKNIPLFRKLWRFSRFVECRNLSMDAAAAEGEQNATKASLETGINALFQLGQAARKGREERDRARKIPLSAFHEIVHLRDMLLSEGVTPLIFFGALLGWYRECSIIPHTHDFDFAVRFSEISANFCANIELVSPPIRIDRRLGMFNESLEFGFKSLKLDFPLDLFVLYDTENSTYAAGLGNALDSYRFSFPKLTDDNICAGVLYNHVFYVPCETEQHLEFEHGAGWKLDVPTRKFTWNVSARNVKLFKKYPSEMRAEIFRYFEDPNKRTT